MVKAVLKLTFEDLINLTLLLNGINEQTVDSPHECEHDEQTAESTPNVCAHRGCRLDSGGQNYERKERCCLVDPAIGELTCTPERSARKKHTHRTAEVLAKNEQYSQLGRVNHKPLGKGWRSC